MGSHSVTCHPAEVTFPPLFQPKPVLDLATPEGCKAELTGLDVCVCVCSGDGGQRMPRRRRVPGIVRRLGGASNQRSRGDCVEAEPVPFRSAGRRRGLLERCEVVRGEAVWRPSSVRSAEHDQHGELAD